MRGEIAKRNMYAAAAIFTADNGAENATLPQADIALHDFAISDQFAVSHTSEVNRSDLAVQPRQKIKYRDG
jgi:hypothetical protein